jgi:hypothetical protein
MNVSGNRDASLHSGDNPRNLRSGETRLGFARNPSSRVQPNTAEPADAISVPFKTVKAHRLEANQYGISR